MSTRPSSWDPDVLRLEDGDVGAAFLTPDNSAAFDAAKSFVDCTAPAAVRAPEGSVEMGTGYDCTDLKGRTAVPSITPAALAEHTRVCNGEATIRRNGGIFHRRGRRAGHCITDYTRALYRAAHEGGVS